MTRSSGPQIRVVVAPASRPDHDDRTLLESGVAVFVDSAIAPMLDDKRLEVVPAGADQVQFTLTDQTP